MKIQNLKILVMKQFETIMHKNHDLETNFVETQAKINVVCSKNHLAVYPKMFLRKFLFDPLDSMVCQFINFVSAIKSVSINFNFFQKFVKEIKQKTKNL